MILIKDVIKILYNPKEAYQNLKGKTNWQEAFIFFFTLILIAGILSVIILRKLNIYYFLVPFGFSTEIGRRSIIMNFSFSILYIFLFSSLINFFAKKFSGVENFNEIFSMISYSKIIVVPEFIGNLLIALLLQFKRWIMLNQMATVGTVRVNFYDVFYLLILFSLIFSIWKFLIYLFATKITYGLNLKRSFLYVFISLFILQSLIKAINFLTKINIFFI